MVLGAEFLAHHGVRGMHWGVRRPRGKDGRVEKGPAVNMAVNEHGQVKKSTGGYHRPTSKDAENAIAYKTIARNSGVHALDNQQLQHLVNRMNMEQQYSRLSTGGSKQKSSGAKFATDLLVNTGKSTIQEVAKEQAKKKVNAELAKYLAKRAARTAVKVGVAAAL